MKASSADAVVSYLLLHLFPMTAMPRFRRFLDWDGLRGIYVRRFRRLRGLFKLGVDFALSRQVIGCAMAVHRALGCGFLEAVYQNAMAVELRRQDLPFERESDLSVHYRGEMIGKYFVDFVVSGCLLVELKALNAINAHSESQMIHYLKASGLPAGLILNFGAPSLQIRRKVQTRPSQCTAQ